MLTCRELTELVTDYVEGRMSLWDRVRFTLHVGMCPTCREYVRQMQFTRDVVGRTPPVTLPDDVKAELLERFKDWKRDPATAEAEPEPRES
jgi:predicted anti-sigma-YlaC factor YlaD